MTKPAIEVRNLGKKFHRAAVQKNSVETKRSWFRKEKASEFWALNDVSFDVHQGDVVGIIGRNGAGKSTLLRILSRITAPTTGSITLRGRVGSLLEVGTGFHPELSGRDNVFMNGAILGMSQREIRNKFDEIVDFSGIEAFIDTPVKHYSSGMGARLAFAVAAHLDPEILIIDEVLAVGDHEFQKKSLGKMKDVAKSGRTVLFVSHNMTAMRQMCNRGIYLKNGKVAAMADNIAQVVNQYLSIENVNTTPYWKRREDSYSDPVFTPLEFYLSTANGKPITRTVHGDEEILVNIKAEIPKPSPLLSIGYALFDSLGNLLYWTYYNDSYYPAPVELKRGINHLTCPLPKDILNDGDYSFALIVGEHGMRSMLSVENSPITITTSITGHTKRSPYWVGTRNSLLAPVFQWSNAEEENRKAG